MIFSTPRAWDNLPLRLSVEEIRDPHEVIHDYFAAHDMPRAKQILNKWLQSTSQSKAKMESASSLQYFYERTETLIEAAYLIGQLDNSERKAIIIPKEEEEEIDLMNPRLFCAWIRYKDEDAIAYRRIWERFPRSLSYKEFLNPYRVFEKVFSFLKLGEWREALHELFTIGLCRSTFYEETLDYDLLGIKKHLEKLIEASHLIDVREYRQKYYDELEENAKKMKKGEN